MKYEREIVQEFGSQDSHFLMLNSIEVKTKSVALSDQARQLGNDMFRSSNHNEDLHRKILRCYSASLVLAPENSEQLGLAYSNKSALLLHLRKYEACIKDIDQALKVKAISNNLRVKLLCRKLECFVALGKKEERPKILEEAKRCLELLDKDGANRIELEKMIERAERRINEGPEVESHDYEIEHLHVQNQKESKGLFESIKISHNSNYGHHLTASTDINPGELICISKPYAMVARYEEHQFYCAHCTNILWSSVPCPNCPFSLYCSEDCKNEAFKSYHNIECCILQKIMVQGMLNNQIHVSLRTIIKAVKELGSIEALQKLMQEIDEMADDKNEGLDTTGQFNNDCFRSIFAYKKEYVGANVFARLLKGSCRSVIALARYTSFFGNQFQFHKIQDLQQNETVLFIASLLLQVSMIAFKNGRKIAEGTTACENGKDQVTCASSLPCCERGFYIDSLESLILQSCNPNVRSVQIEGGKTLWYALQPILKGQPLLDCCKVTFFEMEKDQRSRLNNLTLNRTCDCIACTSNWPAVMIENGRVLTFEDISKIVVEGIRNNEICGKYLIMIGEDEQYSQATVNDLIKIMSSAFKVLTQPSQVLCAMICILRFVFDRLHAIKFHVPRDCRVAPA